MRSRIFAGLLVILAMAGFGLAQGAHIPSPVGVAATEIHGRYLSGPESPYQGGKWIEITYGRPMKRGRDLWGAGTNYGRMLNSGSPVWRAGANTSTRLHNELPLVINGKTVPAGEYTMFIELKPNAWTLIVSRWAAQKNESAKEPNTLWGSFGYTPDKDVVRAPMKLETLPHAVEQLTWEFLDVTDAGGLIAITWDKVMASVAFTTGK